MLIIRPGWQEEKRFLGASTVQKHSAVDRLYLELTLKRTLDGLENVAKGDLGMAAQTCIRWSCPETQNQKVM